MRTAAAVGLVVSVVLAGAFLVWLRNLPPLAVERVTVSGATTREAPRLRAALVEAAREMTTLHVREGELDRIAAGYAGVRGVSARAELPGTLRLRVLEEPFALLVREAGGRTVPLTSGGRRLVGVRTRRPLPVVEGPGSTARPFLDIATRTVTTAPRALRRRLAAIQRRPGLGLVVRLRGGTEVLFGSASTMRAKWAAVTVVLADRAARAAPYVDVRLPERPAIGLPGTALGPAPRRPTPPSPETAPGGSGEAGTTGGTAEGTPDPARTAPPASGTGNGQTAAPGAPPTAAPGAAPGAPATGGSP
jgi:hypothetical protein